MYRLRADAIAHLGDGEQYMAALRQHVLSTGECSHWPEFCLTLDLPAGSLGEGVAPVPLSTCARGGEPPVELLAEEVAELDAAASLSDAKLAALRAGTGEGGSDHEGGKAAASSSSAAAGAQADLLRAAEAEAALAAARRDLVAESRALECSLSFIEERMADDVVEAATAAEASGAATNLADSRSEISEMSKSSEVSESSSRTAKSTIRACAGCSSGRWCAAPSTARTRASCTWSNRQRIVRESYTWPGAGAGEGYDLLCSLVRRAEALRERFAMMTPARVRFHCADALKASPWTSALCGSTTRHGTLPLCRRYARNWRPSCPRCPCR